MKTHKSLGNTSFDEHNKITAVGNEDLSDDMADVQPGYSSEPLMAEGNSAPIRLGDRVTAVVTGIAEYGVFVTTPGGERGLIHISEISDWFVEDARDYFLIGEELQVEVISQEEGTGKYAFSTRRLGGKQPVGDGYTRRLMSFQSTLDRPLGHRAAPPRRGHPAPPPPPPGARRSRAREHDEIAAFLRDRVGEVSEEARKLLINLVARYGPVRVALALADVTRRFDRSLALVNWVARSLEQDEPGALHEYHAQP